MNAPMSITLHRIQCAEDQAETVALEHGVNLRREGLLVVHVRVVWKDGTAIIAVHSRGRKVAKRVAQAVARQFQQSKAPALFDVSFAA